ncbi:hypothetical protein JB92DRAFT_3001663 [Gautieria morchelliformis]|nr:hypothetical protein JB92DRAFT_3001663 [Gautieria morchelliformis]
MRLLLTAIVPGEQVPRVVTLRLHLTNGTTLNYNVPVAPISHHAPSSLADALGGTREIPPLIHTLSAHMLIQDVEGGDTQPPELQESVTPSPETRRAIVKRYIVDLGTQYQVASSHTAFVAVATPKLPRKHRNNNHRDLQSKDGRHQNSQGDSTTGGPTSHDQGSRGGHTNGTQGPHSQTGAGNGSNSKTGGTSDPEERQTQSPASRMPGAFRQSSDGKATGLFDFFAYNPSPESVPVAEVICVPNPRGGSPMIFTSSHLPRYTTIIMIAGSWLKSLKSFVFSKTPPEGRRQGPFSVFPATHDQLIPGAVLEVVTLQSFDGSFSGISGELSSLVNIPESRLREVTPSMAYGEKNESVWATAIAVAYCTKNLVHHIDLWEDMAEKAQCFGSSVCGSDDVFQNIVQEAVKLFQP